MILREIGLFDNDIQSERDYMFGWIMKCYMSPSNPPYPTALTTYSGDMKPGMESQLGKNFGIIREFFRFLPLSGDMGVGWGNHRGLKKSQFFFKFWIFSIGYVVLGSNKHRNFKLS